MSASPQQQQRPRPRLRAPRRAAASAARSSSSSSTSSRSSTTSSHASSSSSRRRQQNRHRDQRQQQQQQQDPGFERYRRAFEGIAHSKKKASPSKKRVFLLALADFRRSSDSELVRLLNLSKPLNDILPRASDANDFTPDRWVNAINRLLVIEAKEFERQRNAALRAMASDSRALKAVLFEIETPHPGQSHAEHITAIAKLFRIVCTTTQGLLSRSILSSMHRFRQSPAVRKCRSSNSDVQAFLALFEGTSFRTLPIVPKIEVLQRSLAPGEHLFPLEGNANMEQLLEHHFRLLREDNIGLLRSGNSDDSDAVFGLTQSRYLPVYNVRPCEFDLLLNGRAITFTFELGRDSAYHKLNNTSRIRFWQRERVLMADWLVVLLENGVPKHLARIDRIRDIGMLMKGKVHLTLLDDAVADEIVRDLVHHECGSITHVLKKQPAQQEQNRSYTLLQLSPLFAYDKPLRQLQEMSDFPFEEEVRKNTNYKLKERDLINVGHHNGTSTTDASSSASNTAPSSNNSRHTNSHVDDVDDVDDGDDGDDGGGWQPAPANRKRQARRHRRTVVGPPEYMKRGQHDAQLAQFLRSRDGGAELNASQRAAMVHVMRNRLALIQGPPGTGKTHIGVVITRFLVQVLKLKVLVVCFTNHALDQFLSELLGDEIGDDDGDDGDGGDGSDGADSDTSGSSDQQGTAGRRREATRHKQLAVTKKIVRLGSRCRHPRLEQYQLRNLREGSDSHALKPAQRKEEGRLRKQKTRLRNHICALRRAICFERHSEAAAQCYLGYRGSPEERAAFGFPPLRSNSSSDPGTQHKHKHKHKPATKAKSASANSNSNSNSNSNKAESLWGLWCTGAPPPQGLANNKLWKYPLDTRKLTALNWNERIPELVVDLRRAIADADEQLGKLRAAKDRTILADADIIGCTTTGAAGHADVLKGLDIPVYMAEEAGEILEAHVLASVPTKCQHAILIGDHKQLRPKVNRYKFERESGEGFNLNVSLFERLVPVLGFASLHEQHRMRPAISRLVREMTYPDLQDHKQTKKRKDIVGLRHNVVFLNHDEKEGFRDSTTRSRHNLGEARIVFQVVQHLLLQGYKSSDIVVLTPYGGQARLLDGMLRSITTEAKQHLHLECMACRADSHELASHLHSHKQDRWRRRFEDPQQAWRRRDFSLGDGHDDDDDGDNRNNNSTSSRDGTSGGIHGTRHATTATPSSASVGRELSADGGATNSNDNGADGDGDEDGEDKREKAVIKRNVALLQAARREFPIKVVTVDNFQGEEAKIVVISLVRSNNKGSIGFLREPERVNVMLSRARDGMIVVGNKSTFDRCNVKKGRWLWKKFFGTLPEEAVCAGLPIVCPQHEHHGPCELETPLLSERTIEPHNHGGCSQECPRPLPCGHACKLRCHDQKQHKRMLCCEPVFLECDECEGVYQTHCHMNEPPQAAHDRGGDTEGDGDTGKRFHDPVCTVCAAKLHLEHLDSNAIGACESTLEDLKSQLQERRTSDTGMSLPATVRGSTASSSSARSAPSSSSTASSSVSSSSSLLTASTSSAESPSALPQAGTTTSVTCSGTHLCMQEAHVRVTQAQLAVVRAKADAFTCDQVVDDLTNTLAAMLERHLQLQKERIDLEAHLYGHNTFEQEEEYEDEEEYEGEDGNYSAGSYDTGANDSSDDDDEDEEEDDDEDEEEEEEEEDDEEEEEAEVCDDGHQELLNMVQRDGAVSTDDDDEDVLDEDDDDDEDDEDDEQDENEDGAGTDDNYDDNGIDADDVDSYDGVVEGAEDRLHESISDGESDDNGYEADFVDDDDDRSDDDEDYSPSQYDQGDEEHAAAAASNAESGGDDDDDGDDDMRPTDEDLQTIIDRLHEDKQDIEMQIPQAEDQLQKWQQQQKQAHEKLARARRSLRSALFALVDLLRDGASALTPPGTSGMTPKELVDVANGRVGDGEPAEVNASNGKREGAVHDNNSTNSAGSGDQDKKKKDKKENKKNEENDNSKGKEVNGAETQAGKLCSDLTIAAILEYAGHMFSLPFPTKWNSLIVGCDGNGRDSASTRTEDPEQSAGKKKSKKKKKKKKKRKKKKSKSNSKSKDTTKQLASNSDTSKANNNGAGASEQPPHESAAGPDLSPSMSTCPGVLDGGGAVALAHDKVWQAIVGHNLFEEGLVERTRQRRIVLHQLFQRFTPLWRQEEDAIRKLRKNGVRASKMSQEELKKLLHSGRFRSGSDAYKSVKQVLNARTAMGELVMAQKPILDKVGVKKDTWTKDDAEAELKEVQDILKQRQEQGHHRRLARLALMRVLHVQMLLEMRLSQMTPAVAASERQLLRKRVPELLFDSDSSNGTVSGSSANNNDNNNNNDDDSSRSRRDGGGLHCARVAVRLLLRCGPLRLTETTMSAETAVKSLYRIIYTASPCLGKDDLHNLDVPEGMFRASSAAAAEARKAWLGAIPAAMQTATARDGPNKVWGSVAELNEERQAFVKTFEARARGREGAGSGSGDKKDAALKYALDDEDGDYSDYPDIDPLEELALDDYEEDETDDSNIGAGEDDWAVTSSYARVGGAFGSMGAFEATSGVRSLDHHSDDDYDDDGDDDDDDDDDMEDDAEFALAFSKQQ